MNLQFENLTVYLHSKNYSSSTFLQAVISAQSYVLPIGSTAGVGGVVKKERNERKGRESEIKLSINH